MIPFYTEFSQLAETETRVFTTKRDPYLPDGDYGFIELFCEKPNCDCHRVLIHVNSDKDPGKVLATINFGWKNEDFYSKFILGESESHASNSHLKGPYLDPLNPQSKYSKILLKVFQWILEDQNYVNRLERHYLLFKESIKKKAKTRHLGKIKGYKKKIREKKKKRKVNKK